MFYVYVIRSKTTDKIYIGQTNNIENRLKRHNQELPSKTKSYTRINRGPWELVYKEDYRTREEAVEREKYLKSHIGRDYLRKILGP